MLTLSGIVNLNVFKHPSSQLLLIPKRTAFNHSGFEMAEKGFRHRIVPAVSLATRTRGSVLAYKVNYLGKYLLG